MRASGLMANMVMGRTCCRAGRNMKGFLWVANEMDSVGVHGVTRDNTEGIGKITRDTDLENTGI